MWMIIVALGWIIKDYMSLADLDCLVLNDPSTDNYQERYARKKW